MNLYLIGFLILIFNLPFGYLRGGVKKFSVKWFLYIHIPVVLIILTRLYLSLPPTIISYLIFVPAFFLGQYFGKKIFFLIN